jgi:hypothetical protein
LVAPSAAQAQGGRGLPLPDAIFYGTVSRDGEDVESGVVKVRLPDGTRLSAEIGEITGTDYSWQLAVPLRMYVGGVGPFEDGTARRGETLQFFVGDELALFEFPAGSTTSDFAIPTDANGETYVLDLEVRQPDGYPLGDVNLSGRRDSADGLLVLRYDIGLMAGTTDFPPGPGRIYLPLCDITGDGQCNSSDALRILQCDAMIGGVSCPNDQFLMQLGERATPSQSANLALITELIGGERSGEVTIRIAARDTRGVVGALTAELYYDARVFEIAECVADPEERLDLALCGGAAELAGEAGRAATDAMDAPGLLRLSAVAAEGFGDDEVTLAEVTLRAVDPAALDAMIADAGEIPAELLSATVAGAHDVDGEAVPWRVEGLLDAAPDEVLESAAAAMAVEIDALTAVGVGAGVDVEVSQPVEASARSLSREAYSGPPAEPFEALDRVYLPLVGYVTGE